ncbi:ORF45 [Felid gammaherpesvirus 1]|uniref:ORF45 n=1 Tax=Felid gammaherpesvirus 1 TaxID=2560468 RepID=A0A0M3T9D0_9GAMA|nr:ORF45 [Felis catus gammaherpesvirus 1]ALE14756.1 ORF45 [Felis catus gammaherpesvirus 1]
MAMFYRKHSISSGSDDPEECGLPGEDWSSDDVFETPANNVTKTCKKKNRKLHWSSTSDSGSSDQDHTEESSDGEEDGQEKNVAAFINVKAKEASRLWPDTSSGDSDIEGTSNSEDESVKALLNKKAKEASKMGSDTSDSEEDISAFIKTQAKKASKIGSDTSNSEESDDPCTHSKGRKRGRSNKDTTQGSSSKMRCVPLTGTPPITGNSNYMWPWNE